MAEFGVTQDEIHFLSPEEVQRLFIAAEKLTGTTLPAADIRLMLEITYDAGLRISECLGLLKRDIDTNRKRIVLTSTKGGRVRCHKCRGKGVFADSECPKCLGKKKIMKPVDTWVSPELFERLTKRTQELDAMAKVFPVTRQSAYNYIKRAGKLAEIEAVHVRGGGDIERTNVWPHILRHSRCVHLLAKGMPLNMCMQKMRHKNIQTTSVYLKVGAKDVIAKEREISEKEAFEQAQKGLE